MRRIGGLAVAVALAGTWAVTAVGPASASDTPLAPTGVRLVTADYDRLTIVWNRAADDDGDGVDRFYKVIVDGVWRSGSYEESATVTQLRVGHTYTVQVQSLDTNTNAVSAPVSISASTLDDTTPPTTPGNLRATSAGLEWNASTDNREVVSYRLFDSGKPLYGTGTAGVTFSELRDFACVVVSGQVITVTVKALDATGLLSSASNAVTVRVP